MLKMLVKMLHMIALKIFGMAYLLNYVRNIIRWIILGKQYINDGR